MRLYGERLLLSAGDLNSFLGCRHATNLARRLLDGEPIEKGPADATLELVQRRGLAHEAAFLRTLEAEGRQVVVIPDGRNLEARVDATTAAMQLAKPLQRNPRQVAEQLIAALQAQSAFSTWVDALEIAGPGFINIRLKAAAKQAVVREVLTGGVCFGQQPSNGQQLLVEFVSANPTGPLHVGHARQAALGDAICNLYATQGWKVYREFYYNDAGVQINTLATSTQLRAQGIKPGDAQWPEASYAGDYIADIAADFLAGKTVAADDRSFTASGDVSDLEGMREFAVAYLRREQDLDLQAFALKFDNYYLESSLYSSGRVEAAVNTLISAGKTFEKDGALWLRSTDYGDDKDRVMKKGDGSYTYFVPDVAYHLAKWERGFTKVVNIQGTDHHGTIGNDGIHEDGGMGADEAPLPDNGSVKNDGTHADQ